MTPEEAAMNLRSALGGGQQEMTPTQQLMEQLKRAQIASVQDQQKGMTKTQAKINSLEGQKGKMDLTGFAMLADMFNPGKNYTQMYKQTKEKTPAEKKALLEAKLQKERQSFIKNTSGIMDAEADSNKHLNAMELAQMKQKGQLNYLEKNFSLQEQLAAYKASLEKGGAGGTNIRFGTKGQDAMDKEFGKDITKYMQTGRSTVASNIANLTQVMGSLGEYDKNGKFQKKDDSLTGPLVTMMPDFARTRANAASANAEALVRQVVQQDLRETLGAQFTENEGNMMIKNAYDPALDEETNYKRLQSLMQKASAAAKAKEDMYEYYVENGGSLSGYTGPKFDELVKEMKSEFGVAPKSTSSSKTPELSKRAQELKAKYGL